MIEREHGAAAAQPRNSSGFWAWFQQQAGRLAEMMSSAERTRITALMDEALTQYGLPIRYEVSTGIEGPELVFSAEGSDAWAEFLTEMVAQAPATVWTIHAQRPRRRLDEALTIVQAVYDIDLSGARFQVRVVSGRYHLRFIHDALYSSQEELRYEIAALFLDYALGERLATSAVAGLDFQPVGDGIAMPLMVNELIREAGDSTGSGSQRPSDPA